MKIKTVFLFLLMLMFFQSEIFSQQKDPLLQELIKKSIEVSPKLKALSYKKLAAEATIPQVENLPDPMLSLGLANLPTNTFSFTQEPMTQKIVGLSQTVPFPGRLTAIGEVKRKDPEIVQQEIDDEVNDIKKTIAVNYYNLAFVRKSIELTKESKKLLENIAQVVKTKYAVSKASQQNIIHVEAEITRIKDKIKKLENKERTFVSNINALLLKELDAPIETTNLSGITPIKLTIGMLDSLAKENRPFLKGVNLRKEQALLMKELAEYNFYPNFNFTLKYGQRDEIARTNADLHDFVSFLVGISIPINYGGKKTAAVDEAELKSKMFSDQYESARQMLFQKFGSSISTLRELEEREELITDGLLPQTEQSHNSALAAYKVGEIDFINVIDAQNKLLQVETNLYNIRADYYKELSSLEFLVGTNLK